MKIGFIWQCPYPWDVRLEKIMNVCVENGHQVSLLCRWNAPLPTFELLNEIQIWRMRPPVFLGTNRLAKAAAFPLFFNPFWIVSMIRFLRLAKVDLLVVRDLPLAFLVGVLGGLFRTPVILDMAENYPAALIAYQNALYKPFLFNNAWLPKLYERASLRLVNQTLVVTEEQVHRLTALGVDTSKVTVVGNTPEHRFFSSHDHQTFSASRQDDEDDPNLLFVGKLDAHRGVDLVLQAMPTLLREFPRLTLTLVGDGTERLRLEHLAKSLGIGSAIQLLGWVKFEEIWSHIGRSTICLIPHLRTEHTDTTLPNKLFDYMAMSKPVVASDCAPLERVIRETECGLTFASGDVAGLQAAVHTLLSDAEVRLIKGQNGRKAVSGKYNWKVDTKSLLAVIHTLSSANHERRNNMVPV
jgi:glycosyltransferase involved in cell wall biosynthesis